MAAKKRHEDGEIYEVLPPYTGVIEGGIKSERHFDTSG